MIANENAAVRNTTFPGWAVVSAHKAAVNERRVSASPTLDNPYHADIILPNLAEEDQDEQIRHAQELADNSSWWERSTSLEQP